MQAEYATDIVFRKQSDLEAIYDNLVRTVIHTRLPYWHGQALKPENIATFLGRKHLVQKTSSQVSRILKRLRLHGLIKNIRDTCPPGMPFGRANIILRSWHVSLLLLALLDREAHIISKVYALYLTGLV